MRTVGWVVREREGWRSIPPSYYTDKEYTWSTDRQDAKVFDTPSEAHRFVKARLRGLEDLRVYRITVRKA